MLQFHEKITHFFRFLGEIGKLRREQQPLLKSCPEAQKIGFPNVIMPGEVRNDLYLTIGMCIKFLF